MIEQQLRFITVAMVETTLLYHRISVVLEAAILFILILIYLQLRRMGKRNKVAVPTLTVSVDQANYLHGDTVKISGTLKEDDEGVSGETVSLIVKDSDGTETGLPAVTTEEDGTFAAEWVVPSETPPGSVILTASALGVEATATFTL